MLRITVWQRGSDGAVPHAVTGTVQLGRGGGLRAAGELLGSSELAGPAVVLSPITPLQGAVAALLIPDAPATAAWEACGPLLNGTRPTAGLQLLRHADRLEWGGETYWVSAHAEVEETDFDPAVHGDDKDCFLTKAPLAAGMRIKICPGVPGVLCGVIYKAEAWDLAMQPGNAIRCPNCGYGPDDATWQPPPSQARRNLDAIFRLLPA
ncbi:MAG: hypothetical protein J5I93_11945 [Pirellulaceae bacterium]|nr:hypothetical protein [Pirellulaceae bacterium]